VRGASGRRRWGSGLVQGQFRQQPGQFAASGAEEAVQVITRRRPDQRAQGLDERDEGQSLATELDAAPGEHADVGGRTAAERGVEEPALPDAGLPADEDDAGVAGAGAGEGGLQPAQLALATNQDRTHNLDRHAQMLARESDLRCLTPFSPGTWWF